MIVTLKDDTKRRLGNGLDGGDEEGGGGGGGS